MSDENLFATPLTRPRQKKLCFELNTAVPDFFNQKRDKSKTMLESRPNLAQIKEEAHRMFNRNPYGAGFSPST